MGLGAAGTATASSFADGDCVRTVTDVQLWGQACPTTEDRAAVVGPGETPTVSLTCTDSEGRDFAFTSLDSAALTVGWARTAALEHC